VFPEDQAKIGGIAYNDETDQLLPAGLGAARITICEKREMNKTLPTRAEIPAQHTWDLTTIYPDDAAWEADFASVGPLLAEQETYHGRLGESAATLLAAMTLDDNIGRNVHRLAVYALLRRDEDTTNPTYQALADRAEQIWTRSAASSSFMRPE